MTLEGTYELIIFLLGGNYFKTRSDNCVKYSAYKYFPGIQFGWIASYVFKLILFWFLSTFCGEKVMNLPFLNTMIGIVYGKRLLKIRD